MRKWAFILTAAAAVAGGATSASADPTVYDFTSCHISTAGGCGPGTSYGTVKLTQNGTNVDVQVSGPTYTFFAGTGGIKDGQNPADPNVIFAFNGTDVSVGDIINVKAAPPGTGNTVGGDAGQFNVNGQPEFGPFGFGITCDPCNGASSKISAIAFTVKDASIADLTHANSAGVLFIADVLFPNGNTGVVDVSNPVPSPIAGASLPGLVLACGGLLGLARRRRQKIA